MTRKATAIDRFLLQHTHLWVSANVQHNHISLTLTGTLLGSWGMKMTARDIIFRGRGMDMERKGSKTTDVS